MVQRCMTYEVWLCQGNFAFHFLCRKVIYRWTLYTIFHLNWIGYYSLKCISIYGLFTDCEHLIRHMLVVEPERRFTLKQISTHRWMQCKSSSINEDVCVTPTECEPATTLDSVVVNHMLQLPNLTFDEIAESVHQKTFNHIYAIYNLLVDKIQAKRNEQMRLQLHAGLGYVK